METRVRASGEQFSTLLEFMESHGDLSNPRGGPQGRLKSERLWCELATILNSIGGGVNKPADKWKKVWADWKSKTKKKASLIRRHASGTGGGPSSRQTLTTFEERVLAIMGNLTVEGQPSIQEQGLTGPSQFLSSPTQVLTDPPMTRQQDTIDFEIVTADESVAISPTAPATPPPSTSWQPPHSNISVQASTPHRDSSARRRPRLPPALPAPSTPPSTSRRRLPSTPQSMVTVASPSRMALRARRRRALTPFDRATSEFVAVEQQRLRIEETRERQLHERETRRIEVDHERNQILCSFADIAKAWLDHYRSKDNTERLDNI